MTLQKDPLPRYAGPLTFGRAPQADLASLKPGMVAVAGVTYDLSSRGAAGARYAPREIRICSIRVASLRTLNGDQLLDGLKVPFSHAEKNLTGKLVDVGDFNEYSTDWPKTASALQQSIYEIARRGAMPVVFGGDQLNSYPLVVGYAKAMAEQDKKVGYIRFSSQLDLAQDDPIWGASSRSSTARWILESQAVLARNMVWVGVNGYLPESEVAFASDRNLHVFTLAQLRREGIEPVMRRAIEMAGAGCDRIYASIDVDVIDGVHIHATSLPSFDGLKNYEMDDIIDFLAASNTGALDITGCNPMVEYRAQGRLAAQQAAWWGFRFMMRSNLTG